VPPKPDWQAAIARFPDLRLGVLGDLMLDRFIYGSVSRISPEAPVPVVNVQSRRSQPGGAANAAANVLSLGAQVELFGVMGVDEAGTELLGLLEERGMGIRGLQFLPGRSTTVKTRIVAQSQQVVRVDEEHNDALTSDEQQRLLSGAIEALPELDALVVSDYAKGVVNPATVQAMISVFRQAGKPVIADPKPKNGSLFADATVIKPNLLEATRLAGWDSADEGTIEELCRAVQARTGVASVIVTAGGRGMFVLERDQFTHWPAIEREVYDVAGAGDSVLAALACGMAAGLSVTNAAWLGNVAGSIAVGHAGIAAVTTDELRAGLEDVDATAQ
jgi:rfaE bifunctional protein kinase chain/domain